MKRAPRRGSGHRVFSIKFSKVYPLYVQKAERKDRTKAEVDRIICWLTGYSQVELRKQIKQENDFENFLLKHRPFIQTVRSSKVWYAVFASKISMIR